MLSTIPIWRIVVVTFCVTQSSVQADVVDEAAKFLGNLYVLGCKTPNGTGANDVGAKVSCDGGFDCSGLVQYSYAQVGVPPCHKFDQNTSDGWPVAQKVVAQLCGTSGLPDGAGEQYFSALVHPVDPSCHNDGMTTCDLQQLITSGVLERGDLLFFHTEEQTVPGQVNHVGIYDGSGAMIDALDFAFNPHGIRRDPLLLTDPKVSSNPDYWKQTFLFAGRVVYPPTQATSLIATLSNVDFFNGWSASGSFVFDPSSQTVSSSSVVLSIPSQASIPISDSHDSTIIVHTNAFVEIDLVNQRPNPYPCTLAGCNGASGVVILTLRNLPTTPGTYSLICAACDNNPLENGFTSIAGTLVQGVAINTPGSLIVTAGSGTESQTHGYFFNQANANDDVGSINLSAIGISPTFGSCPDAPFTSEICAIGSGAGVFSTVQEGTSLYAGTSTISFWFDATPADLSSEVSPMLTDTGLATSTNCSQNLLIAYTNPAFDKTNLPAWVFGDAICGSMGGQTIGGIALSPVSSGVWHMYTLTNDGTNANVYIDGVRQSGFPTPSTGESTARRTNLLGDPNGLWVTGAMRDVYVGNTALTAAQICNLYATQGGVGGSCLGK